MSQTVILGESTLLESGFTIGICAADAASNLGTLLPLIENESYPPGLTLRRIILVASGCNSNAMMAARQLASKDGRLIIIEEVERRGKAAAINQIIEECEGQFVVLVNSDALPEPGAISKLLLAISKDDNIGMISASPIVGENTGITGSVLQLMWGVHNECLLRLSNNRENNHCCDELIVIRSDVLSPLPADTVNDGAYMASVVFRAGFSVKFCENARVKIDVPKSFVDIIRQRRRIVYGHVQIWKLVGESPRTLESMLFKSPTLSLQILITTLAESPKLMLALPVALSGELVSWLLAMRDNLTGSKKHAKWDRFGNRA
jgi:cellulose synthase/poly-beta-1,6-N-acetylglucosamine synthase-like glycosyltransferase